MDDLGFDLAAEPAVEGFDLTAGTPPFVPPQQQGSAPASPMGRGDGDGGKKRRMMRLMAILPIALQKGGQQAAAALLQGYQQGEQRKAQEAQQQATFGRQTAQDARLLRQDEAEAAHRRAVLQQQRATATTGFMDKFATQLQGVDDPTAVPALLEAFGVAGDQLGVQRGALDKLALQMVTPGKVEKNAAAKHLKNLKAQFGEKWLEMGQQMTFRVPYKDQPVTLDELLAIDGTPAASGALQAPKANGDRRGFTPRDITLNGKRMSANFDPDTGNYYAVGNATTPLQGEILEYQRPPAPSGGDRPMTPGQRANVVGSRRSQWQRFTKSVTDRQLAISKVDSGLAALDRGNRNAATQAIILAFNKLQDETSVVREGEYARSEQLAPIMSRIEGAFIKITAGGGALTDKDLRALAFEAKETAKALEAVSNESAANLRQGIEEELEDYGIPPSRVFGGSTIGVRAPAAPQAPAAVGGRGLQKPSTGNPYGPR